MRKTVRIGLLACVSLLTLAFAAPAFASFTPKLVVAASAASGTTIGYTQPSGDDPLARLQILVPGGAFKADLTAAPGTQVGSVTAKTSAADLGGATLPLSGTIVARGAADTYLSGGVPIPIAAAAGACTGSAVHTAFWVLVLSAAGQTLEVPLFIDALAAPSPLAAISSATITLCLPPPDLPAGNPARAAFGAKVFDAQITLKGVFTAPSSEYKWRALVTPYVPGAGKSNPAGTVEVQSQERPNDSIVMTAKRGKVANTAVVTGLVREAGLGVEAATVTIRGGKKVVVVKTDVGGAFTATVPLRSAAAKLTATSRVPVRDPGASLCFPTFASLGIPCIDTTIGGTSVSVGPVAVRR